MIKIVRTDSSNADFIELVKLLDADLAIRDGADHSFYAQFNKVNKIKFVVMAYEDNEPIGCGAIKEFANQTMEVKRMFVLPGARKKGVASIILSELERWAGELSCHTLVLETGKKQPEALGLYRKSGYQEIPNYGQYVGMENSICFKKELDGL
jgi:putative acetyltransferase